jgi:hypothetical protein
MSNTEYQRAKQLFPVGSVLFLRGFTSVTGFKYLSGYYLVKEIKPISYDGFDLWLDRAHRSDLNNKRSPISNINFLKRYCEVL